MQKKEGAGLSQASLVEKFPEMVSDMVRPDMTLDTPDTPDMTPDMTPDITPDTPDAQPNRGNYEDYHRHDQIQLGHHT